MPKFILIQAERDPEKEEGGSLPLLRHFSPHYSFQIYFADHASLKT